jgi:holo-[acyl-carrier protein] synthase
VPEFIAGLGVDIVEINRMAAALERTPRIKMRVFTEDERWYCEHKAKPEIHYALRFAAKEAVWKALGTGFSGMKFCDVEITRDEKGRPIPVLTGRAKELAHEAGVIEMHLSLSFTHSTAVASAVALTEASRPKKEEKFDPRQEIARSFKELRSMLDDELSEQPSDEDELEYDRPDARAQAPDSEPYQEEL